jgi:hypothetical protein
MAKREKLICSGVTEEVSAGPCIFIRLDGRFRLNVNFGKMSVVLVQEANLSCG